jgi:hypothetical protein
MHSMNNRFLALCATLTLVVTASTPADDISIGAEIDGIEMESSSKQSEAKPPKSNASCSVQCNSAQAQCNSEVRRARSTCSRNAAMEGRDEFGMSPGNESALFCSYFRRPRRCGPGCELRFARHYDLCIDAVENTASLRQDCMMQERKAQDFCRQELRDCEQACDRLQGK